jgi:transcriptional regulator with XRE-family HTH domain
MNSAKVRRGRTPLGEMLTLYRAAYGLSGRELAPLIGISNPTLNRIERGEQCDVQTFLRLLAWLQQRASE